MKSSAYPKCYDVLNEIKAQKDITYLFPTDVKGKKLRQIDNMEKYPFDDIANIFSLAMRPCAAAYIKGNKICLFANYGVLSKIEHKIDGFISAGEYCNKIFNLIKQSKLDELKYLFYAKIASQQKSSFLTQIKTISKNQDINIKKELSSGLVDNYKNEKGIEGKFTKLFLLGKEIESCVEVLASKVSDLQKLSLEIKQRAEGLFSKEKKWEVVFKELEYVEFYNYKQLETSVSISRKAKKDDEIFNIEGVYEVFQKKESVEIHAEILAKFISYLDDKIIRKLDDIGISQPPCFLCGVTFSVIDKTDSIITNGQYFLQDGLERIININIQKMLPIISTIELKDNISENIRNILTKYSKETALKSQKFIFVDKFINLEDEAQDKNIFDYVNKTEWIESKQITDVLKDKLGEIKILSEYHAQSVENTLVEVDSVEAFKQILLKIKDDNSFTKGIMPLKVNGITKELNVLEQQTSHWVGIYIEYNSEKQEYLVKYVDPMGHPISVQVYESLQKSLLKTYFHQPINGTDKNFIDEVAKTPLLKLNKGIQYVIYAENGLVFTEDSNINDCGAFVTMLLISLWNGEEEEIPQEYFNKIDSEKLGQNLRKNFGFTQKVVEELFQEDSIEQVLFPKTVENKETKLKLTGEIDNFEENKLEDLKGSDDL